MAPAAQVADVRDCGDAAGGLFHRLSERASTEPAVAFLCTPLLKTEEQKDVIRRKAFAAALLRDPATAKRYLDDVIERPWVAEAGFLPSLRLARQTNSKPLLMAAVKKNPSLALREVTNYINLAFGQDALDEAAVLAPDEAAGLAAGNSAIGAELLKSLRASSKPEVRVIAEIAANPALNAFQRTRVAVFFRQIAAGRLNIAKAAKLTSDEKFFPSVANLRLEMPLYDGILERTAQLQFLTNSSLQHLTAPELYLLLAYGRTEEDDAVFDDIFDKLLLPGMRRQKLGPAGKLRLRSFLATAAAHGKLTAFAAANGDPDMVLRTVRGIDSIEEALDEAEVIDAISSPEQLGPLKAEIESASHGTPRSEAIYGLLAVRLARRMNSTGWPLANQYARYYKETTQLDTNSIFDANHNCVQRYFFYNDDDGIESYQSFMAEYAADPAWKSEKFSTYVHLSGKGAGGNVIEIYANLPTEDGQAAISRVFLERGIEPSVFVHRGHSFHVEKSLQYLTPASKLVYLGSCRGMDVTVAAIGRATGAQVIATRGVGTLSVNDPLLKALNTELLTGTPAIQWTQFWKTLEGRFGASALFHDYIPPNRNVAAAMMGAYYRYLGYDVEPATNTSGSR